MRAVCNITMNTVMLQNKSKYMYITPFLPAKQTKVHVFSIPLGLPCGAKILVIVGAIKLNGAILALYLQLLHQSDQESLSPQPVAIYGPCASAAYYRGNQGIPISVPHCFSKAQHKPCSHRADRAEWRIIILY